MSTGKIITGIVAGAAAGAILGILFAPDRGTETRAKISRKTNELTDAIKDGYSKVTDAINDNFEAMKDQANDYVDNQKRKAANVSEEVRNQYGS